MMINIVILFLYFKKNSWAGEHTVAKDPARARRRKRSQRAVLGLLKRH
jgi:hypothetical protein